jgi:hypothetical protein
MGPPPPPPQVGRNPFATPSPTLEEQEQQQGRQQPDSAAGSTNQLSPRHQNTTERPWTRDHRRTPRSVRSKKVVSTNPFDASPASSNGHSVPTAAASSGNDGSSLSSSASQEQQHQQQEQRLRRAAVARARARARRDVDVSGTPVLPSFSSSLPSYAYPPHDLDSSNNNNNNHRMAPSQQQSHTRGRGANNKRSVIMNNNIYHRNTSTGNNPFDSSSSSTASSSGGERRTPTPTTQRYRNPFDTPSPSQQQRIQPTPASNGNHNHNPFDDSTASASTSKSSSVVQQRQPNVRVTVHDDRNRRVDGGGMRVWPLGGGGREKSEASDSVSAMDSLELILDRTHGSSSTTDNFNNEQQQHQQASSQSPAGRYYAATVDHQGEVRRVVAMATTSPTRILQQTHHNNLYSSSSSSSATQSNYLSAGREKAMYTPPPYAQQQDGQSSTPATTTPQKSHSPFSPNSQRQYHSNSQAYDITTRTSPRTQQVAESLLQSFDQNRRQQQQSSHTGGGGRQGTDKNNHDTYGSKNQQPGLGERVSTPASTASTGTPVVASDMHRGVSNNSPGTEKNDDGTTSDELVFEYTRTEDIDNNTPTNNNNNMRNNLEVIHEEKKVEDYHPDEQDDDVDEGGSTTHARDGDDTAASPTTDEYNYALHDLCDEAPTTDDIAWHNALFLLAVSPELAELKEPECLMTPLHVACLAHEHPPHWMTRGLLYTAPAACFEEDKGGRLPLHLLAATSADIDTMRLLVEEFPPGVAHKDHRGFTPLHLLLKNDQVDLTLEHLRLLLGQTTYGSAIGEGRANNRFMFRRGDHLFGSVADINYLSKEREDRHEQHFRQYPDDVRRALTKITQWKRRQVNKNAANSSTSQSLFMHKEEHFLRCKNATFTNPASIATPSGRQLPLHLLLRRNTIYPGIQDVTSTKKTASLVDLLRILVVAYPHGLVEQDVGGKTPLMTAMLQRDATPDTEVIELLIGLRTAGFDGLHTERPAIIPTEDNQQLPLHVAAEEMLAYPSILTKICEAYPEARTVQDSRGRTPLHSALQTFRSFPVDAGTLSLLFVDSVATIRDNEGNTPFDLVLKSPKCLQEHSQSSTTTTMSDDESIFQRFLDSSIDKPRSRSDARLLLRHCRMMPPWLRRHACAARSVQDALIDEMTSPFSTFRILASGFVLVVLLAMLRRLLHVNDSLAILVYYLASYHLIVQVMNWFSTIALGEFFRLCLSNPWRWVDVATGILTILVANLSTSRGENDELLSNLGAVATASCWLSILGYLVDWWIGAAIYIGSATRLFYLLVWPLCVAVMGIVAASQVLYTLEDCDSGGICSLSDAYTLVYWMVLGQPVVAEDTVYSSATLGVIVVFTLLVLWWIVSVLAATVTETAQLSRHNLSLSWFWEPKVSLTFTAFGDMDGKSHNTPSTLTDRYCDFMSNLWNVMVAALLGKRFETQEWHSCCLRSRPMTAVTRFSSMLVLPLWIAMGTITFGLLWPPQIRRWVFTIGGRTVSRRGTDTTFESDVGKAKLSQLQLDIMELKAATYDQGTGVQRDLALIKDVLFRALADDATMTQD